MNHGGLLWITTRLHMLSGSSAPTIVKADLKPGKQFLRPLAGILIGALVSINRGNGSTAVFAHCRT